MRPLLTLAVLVLAVVVGRADTIDNPEFKNWSAFKPGTAIKTKIVTEAMNTKSEIVTTTKLVEVGKDKLVVETETVTVFNGMEFKQPAMKRDVPKTIDIPKATGDKPAAKGEKPEGTTEEGTGTLKIGTTEVKTKWYKYKTKTAVGEAEGQSWTSDDVPGGLVKNVTNVGGAKTVIEVIDFKKP